MRKNRMLGAAIAAALSLQVGVAQAVGFDNVNAEHKNVFATDITAGGNVLTAAGVPGPAFDWITAEAVVPVPAEGGIVYATELFGGNGPPKLPANNMAAALYTLSLGAGTPVNESLKAIFTLTGGVWASQPKLAVSDADGNFDVLPTKIEAGQVGDETVTFLVPASGTQQLKNNDQLMFVYQLKDTSLANAGNEVKLEARIEYLSGGTVNPRKSITVATSEQAVTTELTAQADDTIKISVADSSRSFTGNNIGTGAHISNKIAQLGFIKVTNVANTTMASDGQTPFSVGGAGDGNVKTGDAETGEGSTLKITGGQFAASKADNAVYLCDWTDNATCPNIAELTATVADDTTATFVLDNAKLQALTAAGKAAIRMAVSGTASINAVNDDPAAVLTIDFDDGNADTEDYVTDISTGSVNILGIAQDGTVCVVYNVPASTVTRETINIRVTNDSNTSGKLTGTLYNDGGTELGSGTLIDSLAAGQTTVFRAADLETKFGIDPWTGRAMLEIISTLPSVEVMALMRNQIDKALLTNLSVGASGKSCVAQ